MVIGSGLLTIAAVLGRFSGISPWDVSEYVPEAPRATVVTMAPGVRHVAVVVPATRVVLRPLTGS